MLDTIVTFQDAKHKPFSLNGGVPAAVLVHGFPGTPAEMRPLADLLHQEGWTVCAPLLPGFGPDIGTLPERNASDWIDAAESALLNLQRDHSPVILIGNSMGAAISLQTAAAHPPDGLILLAPFWKVAVGSWMAPIWPVIRRLFHDFKPFKLFKPDFNDPGVRQGILELIPDLDLDDPHVRQAVLDFSIPTNVIDQALRTGQIGYDVAPQITIPTLVIQGDDDPVVRPKLTRDLTQRLSGEVRYYELPASHDLNLVERPAWPAVQALVLDFAAQILGEANAVKTD